MWYSCHEIVFDVYGLYDDYPYDDWLVLYVVTYSNYLVSVLISLLYQLELT